MSKQIGMSTAWLEVARVETAPEFHVRDGKRTVGRLRVSLGGVFWRPRGSHKYWRIDWEQLDAVFKDSGKQVTVGEYKFSPQAKGDYGDADLRTRAVEDDPSAADLSE